MDCKASGVAASERDSATTNKFAWNMKCTSCGGKAIWVENQNIYGRNFGRSYMIWLCTICKAYVGCHNNTKVPKGTFADKETRQWRMRAHAALDPLWKSGEHSRADLYRALSDAFGMKIHIGSSDIERCKEIILTINRIFGTKHSLFLI
jgi:hypothetical protein